MTIPANNTNSIISSDGKVGIFFRLDPDFPDQFDDVVVITSNNALWDEGASIANLAYNQDQATPQRALLTLAHLVAHTNHLFDVQFGSPSPRPEPPALSAILAGTPIDTTGLPQPPTTWVEYVPFMIDHFAITGAYTLGVKSAQPVPTPTPQPVPSGDVRWGPRWFHLGDAIEAGEDKTTGELALRVNQSAGWKRVL